MIDNKIIKMDSLKVKFNQQMNYENNVLDPAI